MNAENTSQNQKNIKLFVNNYLNQIKPMQKPDGRWADADFQARITGDCTTSSYLTSAFLEMEMYDFDVLKALTFLCTDVNIWEKACDPELHNAEPHGHLPFMLDAFSLSTLCLAHSKLGQQTSYEELFRTVVQRIKEKVQNLNATGWLRNDDVIYSYPWVVGRILIAMRDSLNVLGNELWQFAEKDDIDYAATKLTELIKREQGKVDSKDERNYWTEVTAIAVEACLAWNKDPKTVGLAIGQLKFAMRADGSCGKKDDLVHDTAHVVRALHLYQQDINEPAIRNGLWYIATQVEQGTHQRLGKEHAHSEVYHTLAWISRFYPDGIVIKP